MARGNARMRIFIDDVDYRRFLFLLEEVVEEYQLECWNYCLMPNHYHTTLRPSRANLSDAIRRLNSRYAQAWNRRHSRVGHVFQGRYKDQIVQNDTYLAALGRYVALNPVRARLADKPEDWSWSSYAAICGIREPPPFLRVNLTLDQFGEAEPDVQRTRFSAFVLGTVSDEDPYERIRSSERILGDPAFRASVRRVTPRSLPSWPGEPSVQSTREVSGGSELG